MRFENLIFLIVLVFCCVLNEIKVKKSIKVNKGTLSLDIDFENISFIQIKAETNDCTRNSIKSQLKKIPKMEL